MTKRKNLRLQGYDYSLPGAYFVTICTHRKENLFGAIQQGIVHLSRAGQIVATWWRIIPLRYPRLTLDEFVVMPNHIHGILHIDPNNPVRQNNHLPDKEKLDPSFVGEIHEFPLLRTARRKMLLPKVVGYYKMNTSKAINRYRNSHGARVWQRSYYERIIRNDVELGRIREYILNNPQVYGTDRSFSPD